MDLSSVEDKLDVELMRDGQFRKVTLVISKEPNYYYQEK